MKSGARGYGESDIFVLLALLASLMINGDAQAGIIWNVGSQTLNEAIGPNLTKPPPQPGPATRPEQAILSNYTNSGDVPVPNWAGVEVEADITHNGTSGGSPISNAIKIRRERTFTVDAETPVDMVAEIAGKIEVDVREGGSAQLDVYKALSTVKRNDGTIIFQWDGKKTGRVHELEKTEEKKEISDFRSSGIVEKTLSPGTYKVESYMWLDFHHTNATVSYRYLEPLVGPDGVLLNGDWHGLDMVLREAPKRDKVLDQRTGTTAGSSNNPSISYDAATGALSFGTGLINVADQTGGMSDGVDILFSGDPLIGAAITVSDLMFDGLDTWGRAHFSGGSIQVADGANVYLSGSFSEFVIGDTTRDTILDSYGILDSFEFDSHGLYSPLLLALSQDLKGDPMQTLDLYFVSAEDLLAKTNGFTASASIDADFYVGGSLGVPEPHMSSLMVLGLISLGWFRVQTESRGHRSRGQS